MPDDKLYTPATIDDQPLPGQFDEDNTPTQQTGGNNYGAKTIKGRGFPTKRTAVELLSTALNTKSKKILSEFELVDSGGLKVGKYENGVSGDLRITPNGLTARDNAGITTFAIDGSSGSAVFKGSIQAGSLISGEVVVGNNTIVISGDTNLPGFILYNDGIPGIFIGDNGE